MWIRCVLVIVCALAMGCARPVKSTVSSYSNFKPEDARKSIAVVPYEPEQAQSLEWQTFAAHVAQKLGSAGYSVTTDDSNADLLAFFGYAIDQGQSVTTHFTIPQWGVTGYRAAYTTGTINTVGDLSTLNATTTYQPQYGVTGYSPGERTNVIFTRSMSMDIVDRATENRKWEMRLSSVGRCGAIGIVMPAFIEAAFKKFPESVSGNVYVPLKTDCGSR